VVGNDFEFNLALLFVIIAVVGGIRSRVGVAIGGAFFAVFPEYLVELFHLLERNFSWFPHVLGERGPEISGIIGVLLLILTLIQYPGGIGQQIRPITRWLGGKPFSHGDDEGFVEEGVRGRP
jgi:branched-chain amino acid transport system permease protein